MTFEEFVRHAAGGALVPVWQDILLDTDTPVTAFAKLRRGPFAFLLESAPAGGETWARFTFLGTEPRAAWRLTDDVVEDWTPELGWHGARRPARPLHQHPAVADERLRQRQTEAHQHGGPKRRVEADKDILAHPLHIRRPLGCVIRPTEGRYIVD